MFFIKLNETVPVSKTVEHWRLQRQDHGFDSQGKQEKNW